MFRRLLTVYLAFLTAAAPCLCCCTAGRLLASPPPAEEKPAPKGPCCCHEAEPSEGVEASVPHAPAPEKRCPCRDHADLQGQVTVVAKTTDFDLLRAVLDGLFVAVPDTHPSPVAGLADRADVREPYPSSSDLLHLHHRLRC